MYSLRGYITRVTPLPHAIKIYNNISYYITYWLYYINMDNLLKLPTERDLVFIDIEATDEKNGQEMIQFSAIRKNLNGEEKEFDQLFIPKKQLSNYIINLLKIDNNFLNHNGKQLSDCKNEVVNFIKDSIIVTFGDWDFNFLSNQLGVDLQKDLNCEKFDLQKELKVISGKKQLPLLQMYNFLFKQNNYHNKYQHYAMFDTKMLKDVFLKVKELNNDELQQLVPYVHLMPRVTTACHKIFSKFDHNNKWSNKLDKTKKPFIIKKMEIGKFEKKESNKQTIHYLKKLVGGFNPPFDEFKINMYHYNINTQGIYDIYCDDVEFKIKKFLNLVSDRQIIFYSTSKDRVQHLCESIYDVTKKYCEINYINLDILKKAKSESDLYQDFCAAISKLPKNKQIKFDGYYVWKK